MTPDLLVELVQQAIALAAVLALPVLGAVLVTGLATGLLQAVTGVQDASLGNVPRLIVVVLALAIAAPWMAREAVTFAQLLFAALAGVQR